MNGFEWTGLRLQLWTMVLSFIRRKKNIHRVQFGLDSWNFAFLNIQYGNCLMFDCLSCHLLLHFVNSVIGYWCFPQEQFFLKIQFTQGRNCPGRQFSHRNMLPERREKIEPRFFRISRSSRKGFYFSFIFLP
jgi:hypothetical protein